MGGFGGVAGLVRDEGGWEVGVDLEAEFWGEGEEGEGGGGSGWAHGWLCRWLVLGWVELEKMGELCEEGMLCAEQPRGPEV